MLMLSDEHHTVTSSTVSGPCKKKLVVQRSLFFAKGMRKVLVSEMERTCLDGW